MERRRAYSGGNRTGKRIPGRQKFHKRSNKIFAGVRNSGGADRTGEFIVPNALQRINDNRLMEMMSNEHYYDEILQCRLILESQAAYLAAKQCTEEDIAYLQKNYEEMVEDTLQGRDEESEKKGHEFHAYIVKMLHNDVLMALYNSLVQMVLEEREEFEKDSELEEVLSYHREHGELIQALKDHDAERARKIVEYHLTKKNEK